MSFTTEVAREIEWGWCGLCQAVVAICPNCGNNACNGGYGYEPEATDGRWCSVCPAVYDIQKVFWDEYFPGKCTY
jgi:hypothetical protein